MFVMFEIILRRLVMVLFRGIVILMRSGILDEFINIVVTKIDRVFFWGIGRERYKNGLKVLDC